MNNNNDVEGFAIAIILGVFVSFGWFILFFLCSAATAAIRGVDVSEYDAVIPGLIASSLIVIPTTIIVIIKTWPKE